MTTKTYIIPCVMEVTDTNHINFGCILAHIGPWKLMIRKNADTVETLSRIGVEIDFSKMERLVKQSGEKFDRERFLKDFTDSVRTALNAIVNGEPQ